MEKIQPVKGTRDFYPEQMAFRLWLYTIIRQISEQFGYTEFDSPEIEYLNLYTNKTSEEILREQVFTLKDRDGRFLALRPEITPSFARMVAQRSMALIKPIRWFSFGRAWRYEQPQKGRGREFFQWEINILGPESPQADAEIIAIAATFFKKLGLNPDEVVIRVNDRSYFEQTMTQFGIPKDKFMRILRIVDRKEKIDQASFNQSLRNEGLTDNQAKQVNDFLSSNDYSSSEWLSAVFQTLNYYDGVTDYAVYDPTIARGFDYYTRTVFEAWDKTGGLKRSLFGGGRFDNLTATLGGDRIPGVGMAPGDMPMQVLLEQLGKIPNIAIHAPQVLVTVFDADNAEASYKLATFLRSENIDVECWPDTTTKLEKQFKYASQKVIPFVAIIGPEEQASRVVTIKDLTNRAQQTVTPNELVKLLTLTKS